jgi:hypothetical protein
VDQKIGVIAQNPLALVIPFDAVRSLATGAELTLNLVGNRLVLFCIGTGTDHKVVSKGSDPCQVENPNIGRLFFLRSPDGNQPTRLKSFFCVIHFIMWNFVVWGVVRLQILTSNCYSSMRSVSSRLNLALLGFLLASTAFAQSTAPHLQGDPTDPGVQRAQQSLEQIQRLAQAGAVPLIRLKKAQDDVQDALDLSILKKNLYNTDLLPEQTDEMIYVAQRMVMRRQRTMTETQELVSAGILSRAEAEMTQADLDRAQTELELATSRAKLIEQIATNVRLQKGMADLESEALTHPDWAGKVYYKYEGSGMFTPTDRRTIELAFASKFSRPLPISADGETAVHRSFGFDHRGRVDVALNPDQPEGVWLMHYLQTKHIPYFAFRAAVPNKATGAHIHMGPESTRLSAASE